MSLLVQPPSSLHPTQPLHSLGTLGLLDIAVPRPSPTPPSFLSPPARSLPLSGCGSIGVQPFLPCALLESIGSLCVWVDVFPIYTFSSNLCCNSTYLMEYGFLLRTLFGYFYRRMRYSELRVTVPSRRKKGKVCQPRRTNHYSSRMKMKLKQQIHLSGKQKRPLNLGMR